MRRLRFIWVCGLGVAFSVAAFAESPRLRLASLQTGSKGELNANPDEIEPRLDLKVGKHDLPHDLPEVDRTKRADPLVELRPTLDTSLRSFYSQASDSDK